MSKTGEWGDKIIVYLHAEDKHRYKNHCMYYSKFNEYCSYRCIKCPGSAHCLYYKEAEVLKNTPKREKEVFEGIKRIDISDIRLPYEVKMIRPSQQKIDRLYDYYAKHGELDKPIVVRCKGCKYELVDKYLRYYVAKELGLQQILARIAVPKVYKVEDFFRLEGTELWHLRFGGLTVIGSNGDEIYAVDNNGKEVKLSLEFCMKNTNIIRLVWVPDPGKLT